MAQRFGIAAAGNWIIDRVKVIDKLPREEHLAIILSEATGTGGAPYNVLVGLRTLDPALPLEAIGVVGKDADGSSILAHLKRLGIRADGMRQTDDAPTSYTDVMTVLGTGKRTFFHNKGANALLAPDDFDFGGVQASILHLGYLMLLDELDRPDGRNPSLPRAAGVLSAAQQSGILTSLDMVTEISPRIHEVVRPALPFVDYFIANETESGALAECAARDDSGRLIPANLNTIADTLLRMGVRRLVVIHAPECGFWKGADGETWILPSLNIPGDWIKGTAGAGDAFCAGILYGLHEGWNAMETLKLAVSNAAQCLSDPTTTGGLKSLAETLRLPNRFGFRTQLEL